MSSQKPRPFSRSSGKIRRGEFQNLAGTKELSFRGLLSAVLFRGRLPHRGAVEILCRLRQIQRSDDGCDAKFPALHSRICLRLPGLRVAEPIRHLQHPTCRRLNPAEARLAEALGQSLPAAADYSLAELFGGLETHRASQAHIGFGSSAALSLGGSGPLLPSLLPDVCNCAAFAD
jgi:hypothetical protein